MIRLDDQEIRFVKNSNLIRRRFLAVLGSAWQCLLFGQRKRLCSARSTPLMPHQWKAVTLAKGGWSRPAREVLCNAAVLV